MKLRVYLKAQDQKDSMTIYPDQLLSNVIMINDKHIASSTICLMISCFFSSFFSISLGLVAGDSQIVCAPVEIITPAVHSPIYINESSTDREIYEEKHDEIWRKECSVERE